MGNPLMCPTKVIHILNKNAIYTAIHKIDSNRLLIISGIQIKDIIKYITSTCILLSPNTSELFSGIFLKHQGLG